MKITIKNSAGKSFEVVVDGNSAVIGRSTKCDVVVPDEALSRQHCRIEMDTDTFYVTDLASANGVFIDGKRIEANVKTPFSSFNQMCLGILECTVEDFELVDPAATPPLRSKRQRPDFSIPDSPTKKISNEELLIYKNKKKKQKSLELFFIVIIPAVIIGVAIYFKYAENDNFETETKELNTPATVNSQAPESTPNKFLAPSQYKDLANKNDCAELKVKCASLGLDASKFENLVRNRDEYFIYMNPMSRSSDKKFENVINHEKGADLIAFHRLIHSRFFDAYIFGKLTQINLIINSPQGEQLKVYRLHPEAYRPASIKRTKLMTSLGNAFKEGNPEIFFQEVDSQIPSMEFNK